MTYLKYLETDLLLQSESWVTHLRNREHVESTIRNYAATVRMFDEFLASKGMPREVASIRREHVEAYIGELSATRKPATAAARFVSLQQFWKWLIEEGEVK